MPPLRALAETVHGDAVIGSGNAPGNPAVRVVVCFRQTLTQRQDRLPLRLRISPFQCLRQRNIRQLRFFKGKLRHGKGQDQNLVTPAEQLPGKRDDHCYMAAAISRH